MRVLFLYLACFFDSSCHRHRQACPSKKYGVELARFVHHSNHVLHTSTKVDGAGGISVRPQFRSCGA